MYIENEDDLVAHLMEHFSLGQYAMVSGISTVKISPDIDLLDVNEQRRIGTERGIVIGYEVKLLKYRKNWKRVDFSPFYKGIGQALSYFQFGVDKSILVLGMSDDIPVESVSSTMSKIESVTELFSTLRALDTRVRKYFRDHFKKIPELAGVESMLLETYCGWNCFGIAVWTPHDDLLMTKMNADQFFPIYLNEKLKHRKECLLRKEFKYDKNFLEKRKDVRSIQDAEKTKKKKEGKENSS